MHRGAKPCTGGHSRGGAGAALTRPCCPLARATQDALGVLSRTMPGGAAVRQQTVTHMPRARGLQCGAGRKRPAVLTGFGSRCWPWGLEALCGGLGAGRGPDPPLQIRVRCWSPWSQAPSRARRVGELGAIFSCLARRGQGQPSLQSPLPKPGDRPLPVSL